VTVEVWRGPLVESRHRVHVAVVDAEGELRASAGESSLVTYARSSIKPLQAIPLVEDGVVERYGFTERELALACASHSGEPRHVEVARAMLRKVGVDEEALACGADPPYGDEARRTLRASGEQPGRIHNNCSGKHAGMLALAAANGWRLAGYTEAEHPVQRRMARVLSEWTGVPAEEMPTGVDGCGVVTFAVPLSALASAFARLAGAARRGGESAGAVVVRAMARHPDMVGGTGRLCTDLANATGGRVLAKIGAEGVYAATVPGAELGIALKVEDGARRAAGPALLATLRNLGLLSEDELAALSGHAESELLNTRGERVAAIRCVAELEPGDG